jgi:voltage-dependent potassium channel beta subunit
MKYRHLGRTGIRVSEFSLGSWVNFHLRVDVDSAAELMAAAYDAGINFFDNAERYALGLSEKVMGDALKKLGWRRSSYLISTKFFWGLHDGVNEKDTLNRKYLLEAIDGSLKRLGLEHVDLVFCHRPDPETPLEETVWAMHNIIESGKAFYWGTSEWPAMEIAAAIEIADRHHLHKPVMEQAQYNLLFHSRFEKEYARLFTDYGYGATTWSPLASGLLTGKYIEGIPKGSRGTIDKYEFLQENIADRVIREKTRAFKKVVDGMDATMAQVAIAWILKNPNVSTVIIGARSIKQLKENLKAADVADQLTPDVIEELEKIFG